MWDSTTSSVSSYRNMGIFFDRKPEDLDAMRKGQPGNFVIDDVSKYPVIVILQSKSHIVC